MLPSAWYVLLMTSLRGGLKNRNEKMLRKHSGSSVESRPSAGQPRVSSAMLWAPQALPRPPLLTCPGVAHPRLTLCSRRALGTHCLL